MNGVNSQSIDPMIAQNLGAFQERTGSANEFQDLFPSLKHGQEEIDLSGIPANSRETPGEEFTKKSALSPRAAEIAAKSFNNESIKKKKSKRWTQEEHKLFCKLREQQPKLPWKEFAKHFPGTTPLQCKDRWMGLVKKVRKEKSTVSHAFPIQSVSSPSNPLQEVQNILDFSLHHYEGAVNHLQEIQLGDPLLQSLQQEVAQVLVNTKKTYQDMQQRLTETAASPIIQEAQSLANLYQTRTYHFETVYQHYLSYQTNQEFKEWFTSQSEEFAILYLAFLTGKIDETNFQHLTSLKEKDRCYKNLNNLFIQYQNALKIHFLCFSSEFNNCIDESFFNIKLQFSFLKYAQQEWKSIASNLEGVLSRLQEIEIFFQSFFNQLPSSEVEFIIVARLRNEISLQDFYTKQSALMAAQKRREQERDSAIPAALREETDFSLGVPRELEGIAAGDFIPSQQSSQIQKDFPSSYVLPLAFNQEY